MAQHLFLKHLHYCQSEHNFLKGNKKSLDIFDFPLQIYLSALSNNNLGYKVSNQLSFKIPMDTNILMDMDSINNLIMKSHFHTKSLQGNPQQIKSDFSFLQFYIFFFQDILCIYLYLFNLLLRNKYQMDS